MIDPVPVSAALSSLDELPELRPFPDVASRMLAACDDPDPDPATLCEIMRCDPAVSVRVLRVANSSIYGFPGEICSVDHAIVVLGFRAIRNLAVSFAAGDIFQGDDPAFRELWQHSIGCATIAGLLAKTMPDVAAEEAFLAGMVHDVGKLVFLDVAPQAYTQVTESVDATTIISAEDQAFGLNHQQIGHRCGEQWGLPDEVKEAIATHHEPEMADFAPEVVGLVSVSSCLARFWELGGGSATEEELQAVIERCGLPVSQEIIDQIEQRAQSDYQALLSACA